MMNDFLSLLEKRLETLFEVNLSSLIFPKSKKLSSKLTELISENIKEQENGPSIAPDKITIYVSQKKYPDWLEKQDFLEELSTSIFETGCQMGYFFNAFPRITIVKDSDLDGNVTKWRAEISTALDSFGETSIYPITQGFPENKVPLNAYLIVNGNEIFPLKDSVINIGRRSTNDIVLIDPEVSRDHIQLRANNYQFILFDLGSIGGTYINGNRCQSALLKSGDVIHLGSSFLIYNQESPIDHSDTIKLEDA